MTREELKRHCLKLIESCEKWARLSGGEPYGKVYEENKLILELLEQEPKTGRWVENDRGIPICSCCEKYKYEDIDGSIYDDVWFPNYCPHCGVKMQEVEE